MRSVSDTKLSVTCMPAKQRRAARCAASAVTCVEAAQQHANSNKNVQERMPSVSKSLFRASKAGRVQRAASSPQQERRASAAGLLGSYLIHHALDIRCYDN